MDPPVVRIEKEPFLNMVLAALETFKRECIGVICGRKPGRNRNFFHVTNATALQCVRRRSNKEVDQSDLAWKRIALLMDDDSPFRSLGYFHSHPEWGGKRPAVGMSEDDVKNMLEAETDLEIIVNISSVSKDRGPWEVLSDGGVRGFLGKKNICLRAYTLAEENGAKVPLQLPIVAPQAIRALNRLKAS